MKGLLMQEKKGRTEKGNENMDRKKGMLFEKPTKHLLKHTYCRCFAAR